MRRRAPRSAIGQALVVGLDEREQALAAALDVEDRLGADEHDVGARRRAWARGARRRAWARAAPRRRAGPGRWRRAPGRRAVVVLALGAQALDRAGQRELRAAQALDEVAAAGDAERLEGAERVVERGEAAGDALGQHLLAGDDPVALEQQLGERAAPRAGLGRVAEQRRGQRPAALDLALAPRRGASEKRRERARLALGARARRASGAARAAAPRRRW